MKHSWSVQAFRLMVWMVCVAGMIQGLLIPLLTMLLEEKGVHAGTNGLSASALYIGMLIASPLGPVVIRRFGVKKTILLGTSIVMVATSFFPVFSGFWVWTGLRLIVGIGDSFMHYATQLWITMNAPGEERGRRISQYGFAYGLGFGIGPLGLNLLAFGQAVPFLAALSILAVSFYLATRLKLAATSDELKESEVEKGHTRLGKVYRLGFIAFCSPLIYGLLETALTGNFPIVGLREGIEKSWISIFISAFVWGSLLFQVPLGVFGDKIGRKNLLLIVCSLGSLGMFLIPLFLSNVLYLFVSFMLIGGLVGSLFSLGLAFAADLLPSRLLPVANVIASVHFSIGSIIGPYTGGHLIEKAGGNALFVLIGCVLAGYVLMIVLEKIVNRPKPIGNKDRQAV
ncbi:MFS transporter [Thermoactinomyces mirandus]|uniref:MFS transporter n=1 Tax=Thermoactinomyces mirandus TaxID=2756294 RepID=A0A7W1XRF4_9BACL|nr:MFS transporter [Thermoactinomyces mirandus]MBA4601914.1 MFS transporter [Thermoactinomyces mirandus]